MNLSNRLTFSLVFSVLLVAGFAIVPSVMAAEGGPTATFTASVVQHSDGNTGSLGNISGDYILLVNTARDGLAGPNMAGLFEVLVTFNQDVYSAADVSTQAAANAFGQSDLGIDDFTSTVYKISDGMEAPGSVTITGTGVSRIEIADSSPTEYEKHKFLVVVEVDSVAAGAAPLAIRLALNADAGVYSKATAAGFVDGEIVEAAAGINNQRSSGDFTVTGKAPLKPTIGGTTGSVKSYDTITLTLTFSEDPGLNAEMIRALLDIEGGNILADDDETTDVDEGIGISENGMIWTIKIIPAGGGGERSTITVKSTPGADVSFTKTYQVDNRPPEQVLEITGEPPVGGGAFTVTITYTVAPVAALTADGVTVTGGTKGAFSGSGKTYMLVVDPADPAAGTTGTLTVRVAQDVKEFPILSEKEDIMTPSDQDPNHLGTLTLRSGTPLDGKGYLVVSQLDPAMMMVDGGVVIGAGSALPSIVTPVQLRNMPNLYALLFGGGTIDVYIKTEGTPDVIINEVMWAIDENAVGADGQNKHQWIELYNTSDTAVDSGDITLRFQQKSPAPSTADVENKGKFTDRLSNVLRVKTTTGWRLGDNHGQNGNSNATSPKEFSSMYRKGDKRGNADGINGEYWIESTILSHVNHKGTPGAANTIDQASVSTRATPRTYTPPKDSVVINEVYNDSNNDLDWIELRFLKNTNIRNWTLSYAKSDFTEVEIMRFPNSNRTINAGTILLIVNADPRETNLAAGQDITLGDANQARGAGSHKYWNPSNGHSGSSSYLDIPDYNGGNFLLILRKATGNNNANGGWQRLGSGDRIHDVVGPGTFVKQTLEADTLEYEPHTADKNAGRPDGYIWNTRVWPLNNQNFKDYHKDKDTLLQNDRKFAVGNVLARSGERDGWKKDGIYFPGNRGGHGYDRGIVANGTPGYDNGIRKNKHTDLADGKVVVSELMLTTDSGRYPQWIELHNTSMTNTVDLHADTDGNAGSSRQGWSIRVENHRSGSWDSRRKDKLNVEVRFKDLGVRYIQPNQTILITADKVRNSASETKRHFPDHRVASIWATGARDRFKMENRRDTFLNAEGGFLLEIVDGSNQVSDAVGNLDGKGPDIFDTENVDFDDPYSWNWPTEMDGNRRSSLIRKYDDRVPRPGTPDRSVEGNMLGAPAPLGTAVGDGEKGTMYSWVHAADTKLARAQISWYGSEDDYGTPGHTTSTPLPVSLSFFRPTLENGEVVIRWTTESELDNAGFNILRSDSRNGEFKQVNSELVQGAGTTGERNAYKWVDESAKPGVVYYYQIEDVSFAGERQTLTTTKLKGLISADNKLTTLWGGLKLQQD